MNTTPTKDVFPEVPEKPILYDGLYQHTDKDVEMYLKLTEGHDTILECGIGTGRLAIPWAKAGKSVYGIDYSASMLEEFKEKLTNFPSEISESIEMQKADMRSFDLGRKFSFVCIPFASFVYLLTPEDQKSCLRALRQHVAEGGTIVIDLPTWREATEEHWLSNDGIMRLEKEYLDQYSGKTKQMWTTTKFDPSTQLLRQNRYYRTYDVSGLLEEEEVVLWKSRFFLFGEFKLLLEACGLRIEKLYGDFHFGPFDKDSDVMVAVIKPV
ncbi:MAG: Methyltransferase domain family [uncultured Aureispira sp.]|uniref:Methyltransferase domain family n=1 Tax=uncultured Aureispira sp. TaxID=1331704 RepID=A0A6S6TQ61_9BACT|nr:MAG: Methyltransferase domain family [uncultured Aureispira sp.]